MTAPPGITLTSEPTLEHIERESETDLSSRRSQIRFLMAELGVTSAQAKNLIRAYELDQRDKAAADAAHRQAVAAGGFDDARAVVREEFSAWFARRGDLLVVRGKLQQTWRTAT